MLAAWRRSDTRCRGRDRVMPAAMTNALQRLETALRRIASTGSPSAADLRVINERGLLPLTDVVLVTLIDACNSTGAAPAPSGSNVSDYPVDHWKRQGPTTWVTSGTGPGPGTNGAITVTTDTLAVPGPATLHWTSGYEAAYAAQTTESSPSLADRPLKPSNPARCPQSRSSPPSGSTPPGASP
jgi:hypothetical protein